MDRKKRGREPAEDVPPGPSAPTQSAAVAGRKEDAKDLARRRAAHFAHFAPDDAPDQSNIHVGGNNARSLGMWSSAIELANNREKAQAAREERIRGVADEDEEGEEGHGKIKIDWEPRDITRGPIPTPTSIPSLFSLGISCIVEYVDCVDSLEGLPDSIKGKLAAEVCRKRKMSSLIADLFVAGAPSEVSLPDLSQIDAAAMTLLITECLTPRLSSLSLGHCGRGFGDPQAELFSLASFGLTTLSLSGAYRLNDQGLVKVLASCPNIEALKLCQCSRLTGDLFFDRLAALPKLKILDITDCRGMNLDGLVEMLPRMKQIESLFLDGIHVVDDDVMAAVAKMPALQRLGISFSQVSDKGIETLATSCSSRLTSIKIDKCLNVTDAGLSMIAEHCKGLRDLSIRRCKLSDESVAEICANGCIVSLNASGVVRMGDKTMLSLSSRCKESLVSLDVSFCRLISEEGLGLVADSCLKLKLMQVFGCSQVGNKLLSGHSNEGLSILGA